MREKILFRYIAQELTGLFALGLLVFTFILLMNKILKLMDMVINKGVGLGEVGVLLIYLLPSLLVLTIPMAILLAILLVLGRLSSDSEVVALKASGVSLYQLVPPFAAFCITGFVITGLLTLWMLPRGNQAFRAYAGELAQSHSASAIEEGVFNDLFDDVVIYAERFDLERQVIKGILISDKRDPASPVLIVGEQAVIIADPLDKRIKVQLANGTIHRQESGSGSYQQIAFSTYEMDVDLTQQGGGKRRIKYREMDLGALRRLAEDTPPESGAGIRMKAELHKRFAFPFACLVFGIIGMPLGIFWSRGGRAYGFMASIVVVFCYYLLLNVGESLAKSATVPAVVGIWLPNVLLGALGGYLFYKAAREEEIPLLQKLGAVSAAVLARISYLYRNPKGKHAK